jgi:hypothetical protein
MPKYTVEFNDVLYRYEVIQWSSAVNTSRWGAVVFHSEVKEEVETMAEEYLFNEEFNEWALYKNQECEFDYAR